MKEELKKKKKIQEFAKAAGAGGIKEAAEEFVKKNVGTTSKKDLNKSKEIEKAAITQGVKNVNMNNTNDKRDAEQEKSISKRYEKVGVSPISSKGEFSSYTKYNTTPNKLTEDDKTQKSNTKSNLTKEEKMAAIKKGIELAKKKK